MRPSNFFLSPQTPAAAAPPPASGLSRRKCLQSFSILGGALLFSEQSQAGAQIEEPLIDSVRTALSSAVASQAPPVPEFRDTESRLAYLRWLGAMSDRLRKKKPEWQIRKEFLQTVWYESKRAGLDVALVLGLIQVESNFRKFAVSRVGARGYMQVMPFWTRVIGDGDAGKLFHMQTNLRFGCVILRHYLDREKGDLFLGLGRYNGSRGKAAYPDAVLGARKQWEFTA
ncbi:MULTISPECIES: lytic transglycosylase domain-containing protein [unclassified Polaromonas]|jgi:soluble lytic murein transglycosylase-like protein|uniref:lytic transglycosylase domain-containing protein n=1 Tax=unclassified Polaromonas TaxID=2638319 RepID=UPI000BD6B78E|nr:MULTISPECIES: lytic transglycosylase domain-containing protein [unclassified Polaromonas]OYY35930.1 MAG: lytic transglycosylase [Polaromonas sp. 35-63-35]OYZ19766.1 MAG: lytic transglycosylase [Polaromonas sp. 16-63-31]OYZ79967.1 MAG: lytic transglycosylase [Polaromonas sp. 24-63-21]OZA52084.1 MAG: lytic transglycosylase [Polaromonas sp. 17-63-33]OZA87884.1 MAG: lytic transglycosylase [Polaromonas sp. 39-63-25]